MKNDKDEEILGKAYDSKLMKRLLRYVKPYMRFVVLAIIMNIIVAALGPLRPYLTKIAIDEHIAKSNYNGLLTIALILAGTLIFQSILQYLIEFFTQYMGQKIIYNFRTEIFNHVQKFSLKYFDKTPLGRIVTRVTNDVESLNQLFSSGIVMVFSDIFIIIWIVAFMFYMSWDLSLVTLAVLPALIYATFVFRKKARESYRNVRFHLARLNSFMQEHISGMHIVQLFGKEKTAKKKFADINSDYRKANVDSVFYYAVFYPVVEILSSITVAMIIWYGSGQVLQESLKIGDLFAFIMFTEMFFRPIRDLSEKYNIMQTAMASSERIFKLLDNDQLVKNPENPKELSNVSGKIDFENVWFAYNEDEYVLRDVSFSINPGETVAIVGATGAGKTSVINIFNRFYDIQKGKIKLDGIDISELDKRELRKYVSTVLQDVFLFSGDIKSNITLGSEEITEEKMKAAAKTVGIDKFIETLPEKYNTEVKEKGSSLSVGQKQLISFARALAFDPAILILDEATSSVDTETEILVQKAIEKLLENRTSIVIAHRLSTIKNADKILVMHKGELREQGTHKELLENGGIYYKLYQLQYKEQEVNS